MRQSRNFGSNATYNEGHVSDAHRVTSLCSSAGAVQVGYIHTYAHMPVALHAQWACTGLLTLLPAHQVVTYLHQAVTEEETELLWDLAVQADTSMCVLPIHTGPQLYHSAIVLTELILV